MAFAQRLAHTANLVVSGLAGIVFGLHKHLVGGNGRTVAPYQRQGVEVGAHGDAALTAQFGNELHHRRGSVDHAVDAHLRRFHVAQHTSQPCRDAGRAGHALLHQHVLRAAELLGSSNEIARVGPQCGLAHRDHSGACRSVESRYPFAPLPVVGNIFTIVRIGAWKDEGIEPLAPHHFAQRSQSFIDCIHILIV